MTFDNYFDDNDLVTDFFFFFATLGLGQLNVTITMMMASLFYKRVLAFVRFFCRSLMEPSNKQHYQTNETIICPLGNTNISV